MKRRDFLKLASATPIWAAGAALSSSLAVAGASSGAGYGKQIVLIELKGGNDGLNTVVPFTNADYYALRPKIAISRDQVIQLSDRIGLHPSLAPLLPSWKANELAILQGVGYPAPNLSHFRSIEIWDTASRSDQYLPDGWLTRTFAEAPTPRRFAADGAVIGSADLGPLSGAGTRAIALANTEQFLRQARLATPQGQAHNKAFAHLLKVEDDIVQAASHLKADHAFKTEFANTGFGNAIRTASQILANDDGVAVVRVSYSGFDTHGGQGPAHARLLEELAGGMLTLKSALTELGKWNSTVVLTYAEFGRRPRENLSNGTDHGTASVHFAIGGSVAGGLYGEQPPLDRLTGDGNPVHAIDFRSVYATLLDRWWGVSAVAALGGKFAPVPFLKA